MQRNFVRDPVAMYHVRCNDDRSVDTPGLVEAGSCMDRGCRLAHSGLEEDGPGGLLPCLIEELLLVGEQWWRSPVIKLRVGRSLGH